MVAWGSPREETSAELVAFAVAEYVEVYFNRRRRHFSLGYQSCHWLREVYTASLASSTTRHPR